MEQLFLSDEQKHVLEDCIREKRYTRKISLGIAVAVILLLTPLALGMLDTGIRGILGASRPAAAEQFESSADTFQNSVILVCIVVTGLILSVISVIKLIHRHFGKGGDLWCVLHDDYKLHTETFSGRSVEKPDIPYHLYDQDKNAYTCARYLDWRQAKDGATILFITLRNGSRYAVALPEEATNETE